MRRPAVTRLAEQALNPLIGKSLVVYAVKAEPGRADGRRAAGCRGPLARAGVLATAESIARMQDRSGAIAWPDGHVDAWDHVECAMALSACGLRQPASGLPVAARGPARRRVLAAVRRGGPGDRPGRGEPPRRVRRRRRLARVPGDRRRAARAGHVAGGPARGGVGAGAAHAARRGPLGTGRGRPAGDVRAAVRVREHPPEPALRGGAGQAGRRPEAGLGARGGPARAPGGRLRPGRCATSGLSPRSTPTRPCIARTRFARCTGRVGGSRPSVAISQVLRSPRWSLRVLPDHFGRTAPGGPRGRGARAGAFAASEVPLLPGLGDDPSRPDQPMPVSGATAFKGWPRGDRAPHGMIRKMYGTIFATTVGVYHVQPGQRRKFAPSGFLGLFSRRSPARRPARRAPPSPRLAARRPSSSMSRPAGPGRS